MSRQGRDGDLDIEELNVGAWGNPGNAWTRPVVDQPPTGPPAAPGPPSGPPNAAVDEWSTAIGRRRDGSSPGGRATSWFRRHTNHVIAAVGGFALFVAVVAVASGGGDPSAAPSTPPTTVAPSTTEGRPLVPATSSTTDAPDTTTGVFGNGGNATDAGDVDYRFALTETPDGFEVQGADEIDVDESVRWPQPQSPVIFAADGTTWQTGPWLSIAGNNGQFGPISMFPFVRPPITYTVGDAEARTGTSTDGVEVTTLQRGANFVEIAARGLDPLATAAVANALQLTADGTAVPDAAIPAGLQHRGDIDVLPWDWGWTPDSRANVNYGIPGGSSWMSFSAGTPDGASELIESAPYFLTDIRYISIRGNAGIAGTYQRSFGDSTQYAIWRLADREYVASATGMALDDLIQYAGLVVQPGDPEWRGDMWDDLQDEARACCTENQGTSGATFVEDVPIASVEDAEWRADVTVSEQAISWNLTRGLPATDGVGFESPLGAPVVRVATRYGWLGGPDEFPAAAVAIVDRSMVGSVLRLTTTGSQPQTVQITLEPVDDDRLAPYLVGAVVLPWLDGGFVAQLIAPDGQTIAIQTDADLP